MSQSLRGKLIKTLPISKGTLKVRQCKRIDYDTLAHWPPYSWPYDVFNLRFATMTSQELDKLYKDRLGEENRITLIVDRKRDQAIGYIALIEIDWETRISGNMAIRLRPDHSDRGIGSEMLRLVKDWWFGADMRGLRLDVAASNGRAVKSYLNAGFIIVEEFWREAPDLENVDIMDSRYDFLREHLCLDSKVPKIRFYWMESTA